MEGFEGDQECIIFTFNTYQSTFVDKILLDKTVGIEKLEVWQDTDAVRMDRREC